MVIWQFADKPTRSQSARGLVNSWTSHLAETFGLKFAVNNCYKFDCDELHFSTLPVVDKVLCSVRFFFSVQINYNLSV